MFQEVMHILKQQLQLVFNIVGQVATNVLTLFYLNLVRQSPLNFFRKIPLIILVDELLTSLLLTVQCQHVDFRLLGRLHPTCHHSFYTHFIGSANNKKIHRDVHYCTVYLNRHHISFLSHTKMPQTRIKINFNIRNEKSVPMTKA